MRSHPSTTVERFDYDVFVCDAAEDKQDLVRPLVAALEKRGLRVWYDEFELRIGDSLRSRIDQGLSNSAFGLVVVSPAFFQKEWPQWELDGLAARETGAGRRLLLPIWHLLSQADVVAKSPLLASVVARDTSKVSIDTIADEVSAVVRLHSVGSTE